MSAKMLQNIRAVFEIDLGCGSILRNDGCRPSKVSILSNEMSANSKKNGISAMENHLLNVCKSSPVYKSKKKELKKQSVLSFKKSGESGASSLEAHSFSQEKCRRSLACMCIKDNQPFSIVDDEGFGQYTSLFKIPSRWTVVRDCLQIYKDGESKLKDVLKDQIVSISTDTYTSIQNINYMSLTTQWVDDDWVFRKKILNFVQ